MKHLCHKLREFLDGDEDKTIGYLTGITGLDNTIRGILPGRLIVIGGTTNTGKTSLTMNLALNTSKEVPVLIISSESQRKDLQLIAACNLTGFNAHRAAKRDFNVEEKKKWSKVEKEIERRKIYYEANKTMVCPDDFAAEGKPIPQHTINYEIEKAVTEYGVKIVYIDWLQQLSYSEWSRDDNDKFSKITHVLQRIMKRLNIAIVLTSQLRRYSEQREEENPYPKKSDLRGSGNIENHAQVVLLLYRPQAYKRLEEPDLYSNLVEDDAKIIVAKNKGPMGEIPVKFNVYNIQWRDLYESELDDGI